MSKDFETKKIDLPTLSEQLRKTRQEQGISLEEASEATKIQKKYLEYLENGQYEKLPADIYVKSFLKSYALFLKIDPKDAVLLYKKEKNIEEKLNGVFFRKAKSNSENKFGMFSKRAKKRLEKGEKEKSFSSYRPPLLTITPKIIVVSLSILIISVISIYFFYQLSFLTRPPELTIETPKTDSIINEEKILIKGKTQSNAELSVNGEGIWLDDEGNFSQELVLQEGINVIKITATNRFGKENEITRKIIYEP